MTHVLRVPQIDLATLLREPNPQIDLRLQSYEASVRNFLKAVSIYKNHAISIITERRNNQNMDKKRITGRIQSLETETNSLKITEIELLADLEREQEERKVAELSVTTLKHQLASIREKCTSYDSEIGQYRAHITVLKQEKSKDLSTLSAHAAETSPELKAYEQRLRCIVEGIEKDQLLVRFSYIDKCNLDREFSIVIDLASRSYRVLTSTPTLPTLPILVGQLNQSRDVYAFIRQVRSSFKDLYASQDA